MNCISFTSVFFFKVCFTQNLYTLRADTCLENEVENLKDELMNHLHSMHPKDTFLQHYLLEYDIGMITYNDHTINGFSLLKFWVESFLNDSQLDITLYLYIDVRTTLYSNSKGFHGYNDHFAKNFQGREHEDFIYLYKQNVHNENIKTELDNIQKKYATYKFACVFLTGSVDNIWENNFLSILKIYSDWRLNMSKFTERILFVNHELIRDDFYKVLSKNYHLNGLLVKPKDIFYYSMQFELEETPYKMMTAKIIKYEANKRFFDDFGCNFKDSKNVSSCFKIEKIKQTQNNFYRYNFFYNLDYCLDVRKVTGIDSRHYSIITDDIVNGFSLHLYIKNINKSPKTPDYHFTIIIVDIFNKDSNFKRRIVKIYESDIDYKEYIITPNILEEEHNFLNNFQVILFDAIDINLKKYFDNISEIRKKLEKTIFFDNDSFQKKMESVKCVSLIGFWVEINISSFNELSNYFEKKIDEFKQKYQSDTREKIDFEPIDSKKKHIDLLKSFYSFFLWSVVNKKDTQQSFLTNSYTPYKSLSRFYKKFACNFKFDDRICRYKVTFYIFEPRGGYLKKLESDSKEKIDWDQMKSDIHAQFYYNLKPKPKKMLIKLFRFVTFLKKYLYQLLEFKGLYHVENVSVDYYFELCLCLFITEERNLKTHDIDSIIQSVEINGKIFFEEAKKIYKQSLIAYAKIVNNSLNKGFTIRINVTSIDNHSKADVEFILQLKKMLENTFNIEFEKPKNYFCYSAKKN